MEVAPLRPTDRTIRFRRGQQLLLFASFVAWYFAARVLAASAAHGLAFRFRMVAIRGLMDACFQVFLLVLGFMLLSRLGRESATVRQLTALPKRATAGREWLTGAAIGWGIVVLTVLPLVLAMRLHSRTSFDTSELRGALLSVLTLGVATLAQEITFRGYPFQCLTKAVGPSAAVILMALGAGVLAWQHRGTPSSGVLAAILLTTLLSVSWLRTHAIWLAWGLHFSVAAFLGVVFGLPLGAETLLPSIVHSRLYGPEWMTGGDSGPVGSFFGLVILCCGLIVLYRVTRDYAWNYTHAPIVAGGEAVSVAPPAAHAAIEEAQKTSPLVQILATTPTAGSAAGAPTIREKIS